MHRKVYMCAPKKVVTNGSEYIDGTRTREHNTHNRGVLVELIEGNFFNGKLNAYNQAKQRRWRLERLSDGCRTKQRLMRHLIFTSV